MKIQKHWKVTLIAISVVAVTSAGILSCIGQNPAEKSAAPPPLDPSVTESAQALSRAFEAVAVSVQPAVVSVYSEKSVTIGSGDFHSPFGDDFFRRFFGEDIPEFQQPSKPQRHEYKVPQRGMGSGMILDQEGHILTNHHVVREVDEIRVQLADKREFSAEVVGSDPKSDVAVIRIKGEVPRNLPTVRLGDSDRLKVGEWVLAVGAPFGLTQTVTAGIISAKGRSDVGIEDYEDFLQTDAAINPGNSGGPLVSMDGAIVGMNTAIATRVGQFAGVGFAIPINMAKNYLPTLKTGGSIARGFLGVVIQDVSDALGRQFNVTGGKGALVSQVNEDSPADRAGLKVGDVIVRFEGKPVEDSRSLRKLVASLAPNTTVGINIVRDGKEQSVSITLGKMPDGPITAAKDDEAGSLDELGLSAQTLTPDLAKEFSLEGQTGVLVSEVEAGSPASFANLQTGDLITEANRKPVSTVDELRAAVAASSDGVLLLVRRRDSSLFVVLNP